MERKHDSYLKERERDLEMVKKENQILRNDNYLYRDALVSKTQKIDNPMIMEIVNLQRMRIDNLEREYDELVQKYDSVMTIKTNTATSSQSPHDISFQLEQS